MRMKKIILLLIGLHGVRFLLSFTFDLAPQEAYYFLYSQHIALSYFDHPPAIAWLLGAFSWVLGKQVFAIRLASLLTTLGTQVVFIYLAKKFLPINRQSRAILLFSTTLMISILSLISTPDVPLLLFWALSLLFLHRAIFENKKFSWVAAGLSMGLAFDSKYTAVFLFLGLFLFLFASKQYRHLLKTVWPYASLLIANLVMLPVYLWNYKNGFASFLFQSSNRASNFGSLTYVNILKLLATQSFLLLPPLLFLIIFAAFKSFRLAWKSSLPVRDRTLFLACFTIPLLVIFGTISLFSLVKPNWLLPCYLTGTLLAVRFGFSRKVAWANFCFAGVIHLATAIQIIWYPVPIKSDDTWFGWRDLAVQVDRLQLQYPDSFVFSNDGYKTSAQLRFYSTSPTYAGNILGLPALQFDYFPDNLGALQGKNAIFLDSQPNAFSSQKSGHIPNILLTFFESVEELDPIVIYRGNSIMRKFLVFHCKSYLPHASD